MAAQPHIQAGPRTATGPHRRSGFTLVELLVVILIVGLLAAILTPVVMQSLAKARNAAIKAEIDMLHMAIMNYKNEYGSFPPCADGTVSGSRAISHLQRLYPRMPAGTAAIQLTLSQRGVYPTTGTPAQTDNTCRNSFDLSPETALVFWLGGFTSNPTTPLTPGDQRKRLYDFDQSRMPTSGGKFTGQYHPANKPTASYVYIDFATADAGELAGSGFSFDPMAQTDGFQILCAGRDEVFGNEDDLSNMWPGTRGEYLESLNN